MAYTQFTLVQLRALVYERLGNTAFWRNDEVDRYIREALKIWNVMAGFWRGRVDLGLTLIGNPWYELPVGLSYVLRVEVNQHPLGSSSLWDLDYGQANWESQTGIPEMWAPGGLNLIAIWPASATGSESIVVEGVVPAPTPTLDADTVDIGSEELNHVLDYVEHIAMFKESGQEFDASGELLKAFIKGAAGRNAMLMKSSKFRKWMGLTDETKRPIRNSPERVGAR